MKEESTSIVLKAKQAISKVPMPIWYVAAAGGAFIGISALVRNLLKDQGAADFDRNSGEIINTPANDSNKPSITINEAKSIADQQFSAMSNPGTNEQLLFNSLQNLNGKDLQMIYQAFSRRWYSPILGVEGGKALSWAGDRELDLFGWYTEELGRSDLARMRSVWHKSGLKFGQN